MNKKYYSKLGLNSQAGFTWQELVIAIAVTGLIALVAGLLLHNSRQATRDLKRLADVKAIQHALELYFYDCNQYPISINPGQPISGVEQCQGNVYLQYTPVDPNNFAYQYIPCQDDTIKKCEAGIKAPGAYQLFYSLEANTEGISKGKHFAVPGKFVAE